MGALAALDRILLDNDLVRRLFPIGSPNAFLNACQDVLLCLMRLLMLLTSILEGNIHQTRFKNTLWNRLFILLNVLMIV